MGGFVLTGRHDKQPPSESSQNPLCFYFFVSSTLALRFFNLTTVSPP